MLSAFYKLSDFLSVVIFVPYNVDFTYSPGQLNAVGARSASQESDHGIQRYTSKQPQGTELSYGTHQSYGAQQYSNTPAVQQYTAAPNSSQVMFILLGAP